MFGLLQGGGCSLPANERRDWIGHVCGLCLALRDNQGQIARLTTNYDAALLSVLYDAQSSEPAPRVSHFCPLRPDGRAEVIIDTGANYAAAICLMMAATKLADHIEDREGWAGYLPGMAGLVSGRWRSGAGRLADTLGFQSGQIDAQTQRQAALEQQNNSDFTFYARPTELAVGAAFGHTALLASRAENIAPLQEIGQMYGRIMYLLDSYRDMAADSASRRFNALLRCYGEADIQQQAQRLFAQAHTTLQAQFEQLTLIRPTLARTLLVDRLHRIGRQSLGMPDISSAEASHTGHNLGICRRKPQQKRPWWEECCNACTCDCSGCDSCSSCDCSSCCKRCSHCDCNCCHGCDCNCSDGCHCGNGCDGCDCCNCCDSCNCDCN